MAESTKKGPQGGKRYNCAECGEAFPLKDVQVDHKRPVVPIGVFTYTMTPCLVVNRTYCDSSNLQVLCKSCHKIKSADENLKRKQVKNVAKDQGFQILLRDSISPCGVDKKLMRRRKKGV